MRISTNVTKRLPNSVYNFHDTEKENDFGTIPKYLGESEKLRAELESTRAKMLALAKKMASVELVFWRKVLHSHETTEAGLRVAMGRIRNHWEELGYGEEAFKNDLQLFQKSVCKQRALEELEAVKSRIDMGNGDTLTYVRRYLRRGGLTPKDIGSSDTELLTYSQKGAENLRISTRRRTLSDLKSSLKSIRSNGKARVLRIYYADPILAIEALRRAMKYYEFECTQLDTTEEELENLSKGCSKSRSE